MSTEREAEGGGSQQRINLQTMFRRPFEVRSIPLTLLAILAFMTTLYLAQSFLIPIVFAWLISVMFAPVVHFAEGWRIPRVLVSVVLVAFVVALLVVPVWMLAAPARDWAERAPEAVAEVKSKLLPLTEQIQKLDDTAEEMKNATAGNKPRPLEVREQDPMPLFRMAMGQLKKLAGVLIGLVLLFFMLTYSDVFMRKTVRLIPRFSDKRRAVVIAEEIQVQISRFLATITAVNIGLGLAIGLALWGIGLPNPILWGVVAALLNYVPYLGLLVGAALVGLAALLSFDEPGRMLACPAAYLAINAIEGNVITPMLIGRSLSLNPVIVFLAVVFWAWLWGIPGALLAVPVLAAFKIVCDRIEQLAPLGDFLGRH